jgi:hypothetical protein
MECGSNLGRSCDFRRPSGTRSGGGTGPGVVNAGLLSPVPPGPFPFLDPARSNRLVRTNSTFRKESRRMWRYATGTKRA